MTTPSERLDELCLQVRDLQLDINALEKTKKNIIKDQITPLAESLGIIKRKGEGFQLLKVTGSRSTIIPERLMEKGVSFKVIEYATVTTSWESFQIRGNTKETKDR